MAFLPVSLPIQEILLTNFVTDIATISNANDLILKDKLEDLINNFEFDLTALSIGTDNPINYVRAQSFIVQDTGITFQTGTPTQIIARLEKNASTESVFTVDRINVNVLTTTDQVNVNSAVVNDTLVVDGTALFNNSIEYKASIIESKETVTATLTNAGTQAEARITLTSSSRKNIFVKLKAVTAPNLSFVYDGVGGFDPAITQFVLYIDFDAINPPVQNTAFTIHLVDIIEEITSTSILPFVSSAALPTIIRGGDNLSALPTTVPVYLHNNLGPATYDIGINPASLTVGNNVVSYYGNNLSLLYILDENTDDRLIITSSVGMEFF
jgi:hypothetical protein